MALSFVLLPGCGEVEESGPSYAELLQIYNAEVEALDRLVVKRDALGAKLQGPDLSSIGDVLKLGSDLGKQRLEAMQETDDPNALLDKALEGSEDLLDQLEEGIGSSAQLDEEARAAIEAEIAELDKEIAKQQERVERAKADRDAAERERSAS